MHFFFNFICRNNFILESRLFKRRYKSEIALIVQKYFGLRLELQIKNLRIFEHFLQLFRIILSKTHSKILCCPQVFYWQIVILYKPLYCVQYNTHMKTDHVSGAPYITEPWLRTRVTLN